MIAFYIDNNNNNRCVKINAKEICKISQQNILNMIESTVIHAGEGYCLIINVEKICIADIQRNTKTIESLAKLFWNLPEVNKCNIINAPLCFEQIFKLIKPYIKSDRLTKLNIQYKNKNNINEYESCY